MPKYYDEESRSRHLKSLNKFYEKVIISSNIPHDKMLCFSKLISWSSRFNQECSDSSQCQDENYVILNDLHNDFKTSIIKLALIPEILIANQSTVIIAPDQVENPASFNFNW